MPALTPQDDAGQRPQSGRERLAAAARAEATKGTAALLTFLGERTELQIAALGHVMADLEAIAMAADTASDAPGIPLPERMAA